MRPGDRLPPITAIIDPAAMKTMAALLRDPNMIHLDATVAAGLGFGPRVVAQGPLTMGYVQAMLVAFAGGPERVLAVRFRLVAAVFGGERVRTGGEVVAVRTDCVECAVWLDVQRADGPVRALTGTARIAPPEPP